MNLLPKIPYRTLFWILLFVIFFLAFLPDANIGPDFRYADKFKHAAAFLVLTLLYIGGYGMERVWMAMLATGIFIETVQYFLPYRDASFYDLMADAVGIWMGRYLYRELKGLTP